MCILQYNYLNATLPQYDDLPKRLLRSAVIGFSASLVSDTCSNSIRVVKTAKQTSVEAVTYPQVIRVSPRDRNDREQNTKSSGPNWLTRAQIDRWPKYIILSARVPAFCCRRRSLAVSEPGFHFEHATCTVWLCDDAMLALCEAESLDRFPSRKLSQRMASSVCSAGV
jgi:hypothetical protein